jgi:hypothetical protein
MGGTDSSQSLSSGIIKTQDSRSLSKCLIDINKDEAKVSLWWRLETDTACKLADAINITRSCLDKQPHPVKMRPLAP